MIEFRTLGALELLGPVGREHRAVLTQPKRVAILAFLAAFTPHRLHRRDTLLGLFWPELDQEHARAALRQALHGLRQGLGTDVITSRGDEEVGVDEERLRCDVRAFHQALEAENWSGALDLYGGALLEGFFLSDAPEFERWLEEERARLRNRACQAAWTLAQDSKAQGDSARAAQWAHRAASLLPDDEEMVRRLIELLDELGDRVGAMQAYEDFARRAAGEYEVEPAAETKALVARVKARETAAAPAPTPAHTPPLRQDAGNPSTFTAVQPVSPSLTIPRRRWVWVGVGLALLGAVLAVRHQEGNARLSRASVGIAPFTNQADDTADAYLAAALTEGITRSIAGAHTIHVFNLMQDRSNTDYRLTGTIRRWEDSLTVTAQLERVSSGELVWALQLARPMSDAIQIPGALAGEVLTALGAASRSHLEPGKSRRRVDPIAYDLYLRGRYLIPRRTPASLARSVALLSQSINQDSTFAPSWSDMALALHYAIRLRFPLPRIPRDSLLPRELWAIDRAAELDTANVEVWLTRALVSEDLDPTSRAPALYAIRKALSLDSLSAQAWHRLALALEETGDRTGAGLAWHRAVALDPRNAEALAFLALHYWWWRVYDSAAVWADSVVATDPTYLLGRVTAGQIALERGRRDEAESQLSAALPLAFGPTNAGLSGLVSIAFAAGDTLRARRLLQGAEARTDSSDPETHAAVNIAAAYAAIGDVDRALQWLERYRPARDLHFQLHLRLDPPLDLLRSQHRFQAILLRVP